ncbi:hypothetical protein [Youngiibacter fragilis]|nr:hypothetical protein [Youngiibacter fragilis]
MESKEKGSARQELYKKIGEAEDQIRQGVELLEGEEVFSRLMEKYGLE